MPSWELEKAWRKIERDKLYPPFVKVKPLGFRWLVQDLDLRGKKVLDHGCGTGAFGQKLRKRGAEVIGIDISKQLLKQAEKYFVTIQHDVRKELPFTSHSFDVVLSLMTLHILGPPSLEFALSEINRVLKTNGSLLVGVVNPSAPRWNTQQKRWFYDHSTYWKQESRTWVFNLKNRTSVTASYYHRTFSSYLNMLGRHFTHIECYEPHTTISGPKYAPIEYLFIRARK